MARLERIRIETIDDQTVIVRLQESHISDPLVLDRLESEFTKLAPSVRRVVVDFSPVVFMATEAINCLLHLNQRLIRQGGAMRLFGMHEVIRDVFQRTHLENTVFKICETEQAAIASLDDLA